MTSVASRQAGMSNASTASSKGAAMLVIATVAPIVGETGVQTHSRTLLSAFSAAKVPCVLQTPRKTSTLWVPIFAVRPLLLSKINKTWSTWWLRHFHELALRKQLIRLAERDQINSVIAQCPVSARAALDTRQRTGRQFPIAMACHFNYSEAQEYRDKGELKSQRFFDRVLAMEQDVMQRVDRVIYVSNWARNVVENERNIHPKQSTVIWNGIDRDVPATTLKRSDIGVAPDDVVLMSVGTLEPRKNQLALIELFAPVAAAHPKAKLVLVGDGQSRTKIESRIAELGLTDRVVLLGFRKDVAALLPLADVYVHASLLENCPIVLLEAARASLPIAAAPAGGVPELLDKLGGTALNLTDARSLDKLLSSAEARHQAGAKVREQFEQYFTRELMIGRYAEALQVTISNPGATA
jgi:glycosyltransferase involved in cell wall biosynthesis